MTFCCCLNLFVFENLSCLLLINRANFEWFNYCRAAIKYTPINSTFKFFNSAGSVEVDQIFARRLKSTLRRTSVALSLKCPLIKGVAATCPIWIAACWRGGNQITSTSSVQILPPRSSVGRRAALGLIYWIIYAVSGTFALAGQFRSIFATIWTSVCRVGWNPFWGTNVITKRRLFCFCVTAGHLGDVQ